MKLYGQSQLDSLVNEHGYEYHLIKEGVLIDDLVILTKEGYKSIVATSVYLNSWSSAYKIRTYNKLPKKYRDY